MFGEEYKLVYLQLVIKYNVYIIMQNLTTTVGHHAEQYN
jgi:hypothetical protein